MPKELYYIDDRKEKIKVTGIAVMYQLLFEHNAVEFKESVNVNDLYGNLKASTLTVQIDENTEGSFVKTPDGNTTLYINHTNGEKSSFHIITNHK